MLLARQALFMHALLRDVLPIPRKIGAGHRIRTYDVGYLLTRQVLSTAQPIQQFVGSGSRDRTHLASD
jgi:hypothetical protein